MYIMIHTSTFIKHLLITISDEAQHDSNILKPPKREQNCTFRYRIVTHLKSNIFEHSFPYHFLEKGYPSCPALEKLWTFSNVSTPSTPAGRFPPGPGRPGRWPTPGRRHNGIARGGWENFQSSWSGPLGFILTPEIM